MHAQQVRRTPAGPSRAGHERRACGRAGAAAHGRACDRAQGEGRRGAEAVRGARQLAAQLGNPPLPELPRARSRHRHDACDRQAELQQAQQELQEGDTREVQLKQQVVVHPMLAADWMHAMHVSQRRMPMSSERIEWLLVWWPLQVECLQRALDVATEATSEEMRIQKETLQEEHGR